MRKVSDVILSLENDIIELKNLVKNMDFTLKLVLQNVRKNIGVNNSVQQNNTPTSAIQAKPIIPGLKPGVVMGPQGLHNKISNDEDYTFPEVNANSDRPVDIEELPGQEEIIGKRRTNRYNTDGNIVSKLVPVRQQILYPDGKLVCLANVEILDGENLIQKIRTSSMGEWTCSLKPGQYQVNISKPKALNKPEVKLFFGIDIPESSKPVELPVPEIK